MSPPDNAAVPPHGTHGTWPRTLVVVLVALAVRVIHLASIGDVPTSRHLIGDAARYYQWSQEIAAGNWLGDKGFYQAPLYPYALAMLQSLGFPSVRSILFFQCVWGSVACGLLLFAAARIFSPAVGLVSGLMLALYGPAIYFDGILQKASLDNLLICSVLACVAGFMARPHAWQGAVLGAVVSLLCLTRENAMVWHLVLPAWGAWLAWKAGRNHAAACTLSYLLGAALILAPVGLRNWHVQGEFALTTFQAGPNFYIGNNRNADGRYRPLIRGHETPEFEQADATQLAKQATGQEMTPREVSKFWMGRAWSDIAADPLRWLKLLAYKLLLIWNRYEIADAESLVVYRGHSPVLHSLTTVWHFGILAPLAALGVVLHLRSRGLWVLYALIAVMTASVAAFYVLARYRYPLVPLLIPFAAIALVQLWQATRRRSATPAAPASADTKRFWLAAAVFVVVALVVNWPIQDERKLDALAEMNAGVALAQAGEIANAEQYFAHAVASHPASAEANYNLAMARALQGKYAEAIPAYEAALRTDSQLPGVNFNLAVAFEHLGRLDQARKHYELALGHDPADAEAKAALKRLDQD